ncbi:myb-like protein AA isoform X6 [Aedes aegypti]|uniref:C2H2-type domain-containing protein n=1 Tax=Aedes aegypti TaxID=7159 RepID=A0A1S4FT38_AEDAE|nr:myb-like protein AA isoform X6 [Aedes aegypti]
MKKIVQPVRKVYGTTTTATIQHHQQQQQQHHQQQQQQQTTMQMNAVRKINSLLQSGAVSVTGIPGNQPRMIQKKPINNQTSVSITTTNSYVSKQQKCYVCGDNAGINATLLTEASTTTSQTEFTSKIAKIVGEGYMVIIGTDDVVCRRCITLFNQMDKLETDLEHVRHTLTNYIHRKYNILDDDPGITPPPAKIQKLGNTSTTLSQYSIKSMNDSGQDVSELSRKTNTSGMTDINNSSLDIENQLTNMFEKPQQQIVTQQLQPHQQHMQTINNGANIVSSTAQPVQTTTIRRNPIKMYKCMSCDFKTQDLTQFQPHYEQCKANTSQQLATPTATATTTTSSAYRCKLCKKIFASVALLKQHNAQEHQHPAQQHSTEIKIIDQQGPGTTITQLYACNMCTYKTPDKQNYDDHLRKHIKLKPFKCRVCLMRFETREQASIHAKNHQPDYFKCGICNVTFNKRELLMKHLETHENVKKHPTVQKHTTIATVPQHQPQQQVQQQQQIIHQQPPQPQIHIKSEVPVVNQVADSSTQKLLQATIDEALRDTIGETIDAKSIQFHSCNTCSLTFLNEKLYSQHMKMHTGPGGGATQAPITSSQTIGGTNVTTSKKMVSQHAAALNNGGGQELHGKLLAPGSTSASGGLTTSHSNTISDGDLESIFEKIHSDKNDINTGDNLVITSQDNASGNITYSITLAQQGQGGAPAPGQTTSYVQQQSADGIDSKMVVQNQLQQQASVGIDMPTLDQGDDQHHQQQQQQQQANQSQPKQEQMNMPVSMPSLDDDGDQSQNSQNSNAEGVPMELEGMQDADGQQIKFILNENGQLLQLDNHILTTDAEGNQILVQGTDSEQIQQLLQSVGVVMQGGEGLGDGETLQMISGDGQTGQMILVQGADGQEQLIDASLLNADGNIVIQQSQEGELNAEGTHITTQDGLQIPVSVAFATSGEVDQEGNLTVMAGGEGGDQQIQLHLQQHAGEGDEGQQHIEDAEGQQAILTESGHIILQAQDQVGEQHQKQQDGSDESSQHATVSAGVTGSTTTGSTSTGNGTSATTTTSNPPEQELFNFDELIQPQVVIKQQPA